MLPSIVIIITYQHIHKATFQYHSLPNYTTQKFKNNFRGQREM